MPAIYEYGYLTTQKGKLDEKHPPFRSAVNQTLSNMRVGLFNTSKTRRARGSNSSKIP
jgi:hypothetical protein